MADARYESLENYLYLDSTEQVCFIKSTNYDQKKSKKLQKQIGRMENITYDTQEDCFICTQGRKLPLYRERTEEKDGQLVSTAWYRCERCAGCPCRRADAAAPKIQNSRNSFACRKSSWRSVRGPNSALPPREASICVSDAPFRRRAFSLQKNDFGFRRFLARSRTNTRTELFLLAITFYLKKYWMKREHVRIQTRLSEKMTT